MKKSILIIIGCIALSISLHAQDFDATTDPGNVKGTVLWFRADEDIYSDTARTTETVNSATVVYWGDQSGNGYHAYHPDQGNEPIFTSNSINSNPALTFDGLDDYLPVSKLNYNNGNVPLTISIFTVLKTNSDLPGIILSYDASEYFRFSTNISFNNEDKTTNYGLVVEDPPLFFGNSDESDDVPHLLGASYDLTTSTIDNGFYNVYLYFDGSVDDSTRNNSSFDSSDLRYGYIGVGSEATQFDQSGGGKRAPSHYFQGDMAEIIYYERVLSELERQRVESYLAIKYGITLHASVSYLNSDGTVIWDANANAAYSHDIAGIGRDDQSALGQRASMSVNADAMVRIESDSFSNDLAFIIWGNNDGSSTFGNSDVDAASYGSRLSRVWKAAVAGMPGSVEVTMTIPGNTGASSQYVLLVDDDSVFSAGTVSSYTSSGIIGDKVVFSDVTFSDSNYFTVAQVDAFVTRWAVEAEDLTVNIPTAGSGYNYDVSWGDGTMETGVTGDASHSYDAAGTYTISITGAFPRIYFNDSGDKDKLVSIDQWGDIAWTSMVDAFYGCSKVTSTATDAPNLSGVSMTYQMFRGASSFNGNVSSWDVSNVKNMGNMFQEASNFNGDVSSWKVGSVTNMNSMFASAEKFNRDLNGWDVSNVKNMGNMFNGASNFNGDVSSWKVGSVTNMNSMFASAEKFNQDLNGWDVSNVKNMGNMFQGANSFNQDLSNWKTINVTYTGNMFNDAAIFNGDVSTWNISKVKNMVNMFKGAKSFNGDVSNWDVSNVTNMVNMFHGASSFNGDVSNWDVSSVTNMVNIFHEASNFNGDVSNWDVSSVTNMINMFKGASMFDHSLGAWDISQVTTMAGMLDGTGLSIPNYDASLLGWSNLSKEEFMIPIGITLGASGLVYSDTGKAGRDTLTGIYSWIIDGDTYLLPSLNTISLASSNADTTRAIMGDVVTLRFTSNVALKDVVVSMLGDTVNATTSDHFTWSASYTLVEGDGEGYSFPFTIDYTDAADIPGLQGTKTTDGSDIVYDGNSPLITSASVSPTIVSGSTSEITVTIVLDDAMDSSVSPTFAFSSGASALQRSSGVYSTSTLTNDTYTATYTVVDASVSVLGIDFTVAGFVDDLGNPQVTDYTLRDAFSIDQQSPTLSLVSMVSENANTAYAKASDTVTLTFMGSEPLSSVVVEIASTSVTPTNTGENRWEAQYVMTSEDTEGAISYEITYTDASGNSVTNTDFGNVTYDKTPPVLSPADSTITNVAENDSVVTLLTVIATDASAVTFSGADGADQRYFSVSTTNSTTGKVRWDNFSPDYEHPQDADSNNVYWGCLTVADEAGNTTSHCYCFDIQDVDELLSFRIDTIADVVVAENVGYTSVMPGLSGDVPVGSVTWSLGGVDRELFYINSNTGEVRLDPQDYESPSDANTDNTYEVTITTTDADGNYANESWKITVTDILEPSSFRIDTIADVVVAENVGYTSVTPSLSGDVPIGSVTWSLSGADQGLFSINSRTGVVTLAAQDYESPSDGNTDNTYEVTIMETDADGNYADESWTVTVTDVPEGDIFYPNPASTVLNIKDAPSYVKISILDLKGKKVEYGQLSTDKYDVSSLNTGIYVLEIQTKYGFKRRFKLKVQQ